MRVLDLVNLNRFAASVLSRVLLKRMNSVIKILVKLSLSARPFQFVYPAVALKTRRNCSPLKRPRSHGINPLITPRSRISSCRPSESGSIVTRVLFD